MTQTILRRRTDRLYHQFLKPLKIDHDKLPFLVSKLYDSGFIILWSTKQDPEVELYIETEKLINHQNKDELFKLIHSLKGPNQ